MKGYQYSKSSRKGRKDGIQTQAEVVFRLLLLLSESET